MPRPDDAPGFPPVTWRTLTPAPQWEDALITGSGRVGAMLFGDLDALTVSVSHERFFLPANPRPHAPRITPVLDELRAAVLAGDSEGASDLVDRAARDSGFDGGLIWTDPLGICATLVLRGAHGELTGREMDLLHGEVRVQWEDEAGGACTLSALAPRDGEEVWLRVESARELRIELELGLTGQADERAAAGAPSYADAVRGTVSGGTEGRVIAASREAVEAAVRAETSVSVRTRRHGDASWTASEQGDGLVATLVSGPGEPAFLRLAMDVQEEPRPDVAPQGPVVAARPDAQPGTAGAADPADDLPDWEALRRHQAATHGELVGRSRLRLDGDPRPATVEELWQRAREGDAAARRRVVETAYLSGRANAISATGELPPTLQGVWQGSWSPAWSADYTMNGNVQNGGAASLISTGTPELARSLLRLVLPHLEDYRENARRILGADGMLLPARMSDHGRANHFLRPFPHLFWVGCGGWVLRFAADIVETTGDRSLVDDALWELVHGVLELAETGTVVGPDGQRHVVPSYSPENHPHPGMSPLVADATVDVAILRDAARATRVLGEARGDRGLEARWDRVVEALPPYRVAEDGSLAEWIGEHWPENHAHRHTSQLYPLWYDPDEAFVGPSAEAERLRAAAAGTIAARLAWRAEDPVAPPGRMEMAFGLVQLGMAAAALGDAESALTCAEWLAVDHWAPALTTRHDAGRIFNLDPSGGLPALVASMLLGSSRDALRLLPALPAEWADGGAVTGLRARGGIVVESLEWDRSGGTVTLRRPVETAWLRPAAPTRVEVGAPFRLEDATAARDGIVVGDAPLTLRLVRDESR